MMKHHMFSKSGTTAAIVAFCGPFTGQMLGRNTSYTCDDTGTLKFYRAGARTPANAAAAASTSLAIKTDSAGKVAGALLTTSDYVLVADSSGTGYQLRSIAAVGAVADGVVTLTLGAAATCAALDTVYIVRAADIVSMTTGAETKLDMRDVWSGLLDMPVAIELTGSTGAKLLAGNFEVANR